MSWKSKFSNTTRTLAQFPDSGRLGQVFGTREWVVHPNYMIVYKITETAVLIAAMVHTKQRYP
ncbi:MULTISPECIES: type II toxin-antitoxin system RelE/ParE family toxin [Neisseria]|uniref:type II toxin-antitoxin system RelE/ParE family toxin n=1 Tax=Neisseria TaxID=482 RepID=UPI0012FE1EBA|nr:MULTISPECIES: type II toxin-antitoxin system RelE/ParE family toxin [Neisseria]